tara:strand:+ start:7090 stop:8058 length:969 start_codon:yes stop_codon:yes gene_type:complete
MDNKIKVDLYARMVLIRVVEEMIAERYDEQKMRCPTHLSIGQEAVSAAAGIALSKEDLVVSTHRSHGHYIGKGGDIPRMIAEIYGKETGCSKGKGGSMHLIDQNVGFMGSTAIVGNSIPVGAGLGMSLKLDQSKNISCIFIGDGAVEEGVFAETVNFCAQKELPVLFICENNFYSVYSPLSKRQPKDRQIFTMVEAMGIKSTKSNGNNVFEVYDQVIKAKEYINSFGKPFFLEFDTYRWREHCGPNYDNDLGYRTEEEFLDWKKKDPIPFAGNNLLKDKIISAEELEDIRNTANQSANDAFNYAEESPFPPQEAAYEDVYSV